MTLDDFAYHDHNSTYDYNMTRWFIYDCNLKLDHDYRRIVLFLMSLFTFMVGLVENGLVLWVNWRRRHSASGVLFCILNVSLSDMMMVLTSPFYMLEFTMDKVWIWGRFLCRVTHLIFLLNFYSSSFFLALMTLERYLSLARPSSHPFFPPDRTRRWLLCGGVWLLSLVLALIENVHVDLLEWDEPGCYLMPENNYTGWFVGFTFLALIFQFLGPSAIIITCNVLIARAVRSAPDVQGRRDVWLVHVYSLVFVLTWLPYHFVFFLLMVDDLDPHLFSCNAVELLYFSYEIVQCVSLFHCVANPILYNFLSKSFRTNLINRVVEHLPPPEANANAADATPVTKTGNQRKLSNASTSQSDVGS
ncbi:G-protein coupled receptor 182 [Sardina pilchardus]|uniref:G-protein coupled receptor 182 n=1 Tax=Sardina pilchardus TaxID=27697 RepID=UPI002E1638FE